MAVETPPVIQPAPPRPDRSDPDSFPELADGWTRWERDEMMPGVEAIADNVAHNATEAVTAVAAAMAAGLANAASNAASAAADRVQTGLDRVATGQDRTQTGLDRAAVAAGLASIADGPVASVNGKTGVAVLAATDIAPAATPAEMAAGAVTDYRSMSPALVANAITAKAAITGDVLITARNPGAGWLPGNTLYLQSAYTALFAQVGLIKDTPVGDVWTSLSNLTPAQLPTRLLRVNATTWIALGTSGRIYRTLDSGNSWTLVYTTGVGAFYDIARDEVSGTIFVCGAAGTLWVSTNDGASFSIRSQTVSQATLFAIIVFSATVICAADGNNIYRSVDGGANWSSVFVPPSGVSADPSFRYSNSVGYFIRGGTGEVFATVNAGLSWSGSSAGYSINSVVRVDANNIYMTSSSGLLRAGVAANGTPVGAALVPGPAGAESGGTGINLVSIAKIGSTWLITGGGGGYRTTDNFQTFQRISTVGFSARFLMANSDNEVIALTSSSSPAFKRSRDFSYDETTQFKTPSVAGVLGATAYVKA